MTDKEKSREKRNQGPMHVFSPGEKLAIVAIEAMDEARPDFFDGITDSEYERLERSLAKKLPVAAETARAGR